MSSRLRLRKLHFPEVGGHAEEEEEPHVSKTGVDNAHSSDKVSFCFHFYILYKKEYLVVTGIAGRGAGAPDASEDDGKAWFSIRNVVCF